MINLYVYYKTMFLKCQVVLLKILNHVKIANGFNMVELKIVTVDATKPTKSITVMDICDFVSSTR